MGPYWNSRSNNYHLSSEVKQFHPREEEEEKTGPHQGPRVLINAVSLGSGTTSSLLNHHHGDPSLELTLVEDDDSTVSSGSQVRVPVSDHEKQPAVMLLQPAFDTFPLESESEFASPPRGAHNRRAPSPSTSSPCKTASSWSGSSCGAAETTSSFVADFANEFNYFTSNKSSGRGLALFQSTTNNDPFFVFPPADRLFGGAKNNNSPVQNENEEEDYKEENNISFDNETCSTTKNTCTTADSSFTTRRGQQFGKSRRELERLPSNTSLTASPAPAVASETEARSGGDSSYLFPTTTPDEERIAYGSLRAPDPPADAAAYQPQDSAFMSRSSLSSGVLALASSADHRQEEEEAYLQQTARRTDDEFQYTTEPDSPAGAPLDQQYHQNQRPQHQEVRCEHEEPDEEDDDVQDYFEEDDNTETRTTQELVYWSNLVACRLTTHGKLHIQTADAYMKLGNAQLNAKEYTSAQISFQMAYRIFRNVQKPLGVALAMERMGIATMMTASSSSSSSSKPDDVMESLQRAYTVLLEAFRIRQVELGSWHADTVDCMNWIAKTHMLANNLKAARHCYWQVFWVRRAIYGNDHPSIAVAAHDLANLFVKCGHYSDAASFFHISKEIYIDKMGLPAENPSVKRLLRDERKLRQRQQRARATSTTAR